MNRPICVHLRITHAPSTGLSYNDRRAPTDPRQPPRSILLRPANQPRPNAKGDHRARPRLRADHGGLRLLHSDLPRTAPRQSRPLLRHGDVASGSKRPLDPHRHVLPSPMPRRRPRAFSVLSSTRTRGFAPLRQKYLGFRRNHRRLAKSRFNDPLRPDPRHGKRRSHLRPGPSARMARTRLAPSVDLALRHQHLFARHRHRRRTAAAGQTPARRAQSGRHHHRLNPLDRPSPLGALGIVRRPGLRFAPQLSHPRPRSTPTHRRNDPFHRRARWGHRRGFRRVDARPGLAAQSPRL